MKNFRIGSEIVSMLKADAEVRRLVGNKIFPIIAVETKEAEVTFPFLIYRRSGYRPATTKDYQGEIVTVDFAVASKTYNEAVTIADAVCDALKGRETDIIEDIKVISLFEDFIEEAYVERITLQIDLK